MLGRQQTQARDFEIFMEKPAKYDPITFLLFGRNRFGLRGRVDQVPIAYAWKHGAGADSSARGVHGRSRPWQPDYRRAVRFAATPAGRIWVP